MFENVPVKDWMTSPAMTIRPSQPVSDAHELMTEYGIRRLPVVVNEILVGIVTQNDVREASPSSATTLSIWEVNYLWSKLTIRDIMEKSVIGIREDDSVYDAARKMMDFKISGLPVLSSTDQVVGVITESDIFRMIVQLHEAQPSGEGA